jgi:iron-sulfur cluster insertion protein
MAQTSPAQDVQPSFTGRISHEIKLTPAAQQQLKLLLEAEDQDEVKGLRIFVAGGGCSGMTYGMTYAIERFEHDSVLEQDGVAVFVDAVALNFLEGVEIDFQEQPTGASFVFKNVFQAIGGGGACAGCGNAQI